MTDLERAVRLARRRLWFNRWLRVLGWCAAGGAAAYILVTLPNKLFFFVANPWFAPVAAMGCAGAALLASLVWFVATRDSLGTAAAALDVAAGLKERISTGLYCESLADPFAQAVVWDAERISRSVRPQAHLRVAFPRSGGYALGTIVVAAILSFAIPPMDLLGRQERREEEQRKQEVLRRTQVVARKTLEQARQLAQDNPLLEKLAGMPRLDDEARAQTPAEIRQEAIKKIDSMIRNVERQEGRAEGLKLDTVKKMLRRVSDLQTSRPGAFQQLNRALVDGDFRAAREALDQIRRELDKVPQSPEQREQVAALKQQMAALAERLDKAARVQQLDRKTAEGLARRGLDAREVEKKLTTLRPEELEKLARELEQRGASKQEAQQIVERIRQQQEACRTCQRFGQGLAMAASGAGSQGSGGAEGDAGAAGLQMAAGQLSELEQAQQALGELEATLAELSNLKEGLSKPCSRCNGTGLCDGRPCAQCSGSGCGAGGVGPGMGSLGTGRGGIAPKAETVHRLTPRKTNVFTDKGSIIGQSWTEGEQIRGQALSEFVETAIATQRDVAEAIRKETLPRQYRSTTGNYFRRVVEDVGGRPVGAGEEDPAQ